MASALCFQAQSHRSLTVAARPGPAPGQACPTVNKNKTTTVCLTLGLIFGWRTLFFRPLQQNFDTCGGIGVVIRLEMQFGDPPQIQTAGQFMPQVIPSMLQGGQGLFLLVLDCRPGLL